MALCIVAILKNQSYETIDLPFVLWLPMPSLYVLSLFTTLGSNKSISRRLVARQEKSQHTTGFQPGRLAAAYAIQPVFVSPRPAAQTSSLSTGTDHSMGRASEASADEGKER